MFAGLELRNVERGWAGFLSEDSTCACILCQRFRDDPEFILFLEGLYDKFKAGKTSRSEKSRLDAIKVTAGLFLDVTVSHAELLATVQSYHQVGEQRARILIKQAVKRGDICCLTRNRRGFVFCSPEDYDRLKSTVEPPPKKRARKEARKLEELRAELEQLRVEARRAAGRAYYWKHRDRILAKNKEIRQMEREADLFFQTTAAASSLAKSLTEQDQHD